MIKIDWTLLLQVGNFVMLLLFLQFLLVRPLQALVARRQKELDSAASRARHLEEETTQRRATYLAQIEAVKQQGHDERVRILAEAREEEERLLTEASSCAVETMQSIRDGIACQYAEVAGHLSDQTQDLAKSMAARILGRQL